MADNLKQQLPETCHSLQPCHTKQTILSAREELIWDILNRLYFSWWSILPMIQQIWYPWYKISWSSFSLSEKQILFVGIQRQRRSRESKSSSKQQLTRSVRRSYFSLTVFITLAYSATAAGSLGSMVIFSLRRIPMAVSNFFLTSRKIFFNIS